MDALCKQIKEKENDIKRIRNKLEAELTIIILLLERMNTKGKITR